MENLKVIICQSEEDFKIAQQLTIDYLEWLGMDLDYQGTEEELESLNIMYNKPKGCFIYATIDNEIVGGVGVRYLEKDICEMKRLFVYSKYQNNQIGLQLCQRLIKESQLLGYTKMRLDTVEKLEPAIGLYQKLGFYTIPAYCKNPDATAQFMELIL